MSKMCFHDRSRGKILEVSTSSLPWVQHFDDRCFLSCCQVLRPVLWEESEVLYTEREKVIALTKEMSKKRPGRALRSENTCPQPRNRAYRLCHSKTRNSGLIKHHLNR